MQCYCAVLSKITNCAQKKVEEVLTLITDIYFHTKIEIKPCNIFLWNGLMDFKSNVKFVFIV